jgi:hypothetical protein
MMQVGVIGGRPLALGACGRTGLITRDGPWFLSVHSCRTTATVASGEGSTIETPRAFRTPASTPGRSR